MIIDESSLIPDHFVNMQGETRINEEQTYSEWVNWKWQFLYNLKPSKSSLLLPTYSDYSVQVS